jgi:hypothetical protein
MGGDAGSLNGAIVADSYDMIDTLPGWMDRAGVKEHRALGRIWPLVL